MYNSNLMLGSSTAVEQVIRDELTEENQKKDLKLTYKCPSQWMVEGTAKTSNYSEYEESLLVVDPETCEPAPEVAKIGVFGEMIIESE